MKSRRRPVLDALGSILAAASLLLAAALAPLHAGGAKSLRGRQRLTAERSVYLPSAVKTPVVLWSSQPKPDIGAAIRAAAPTDPNATPEKPENGKAELQALGAAPDRSGEVFEGSQPPAPYQDPDVARVDAHVESELSAMGQVLGVPDHPLFSVLRAGSRRFLSRLDVHIQGGRIAPRHEIRLSEADPAKPVVDRWLKIGLNPMAGDPPTWGHLQVMGHGMANDQFPLDKMVALPAGADGRKPLMTPPEIRHPLNRAVLAPFAPFFAMSPIALGSSLDGETNAFKLFRLNPLQKIHLFYFAGEDHYKLKNDRGEDDTLPKLERNMGDPSLGFNPAVHRVSVVFTERVEAGKERPKKRLADRIRDKEVPTGLDAHALPQLDFISSSTQVKKGDFALMPFSAYDYVRRNKLGLYGIAVDGAR